jgi:hypothetical protein
MHVFTDVAYIRHKLEGSVPCEGSTWRHIGRDNNSRNLRIERDSVNCKNTGTLTAGKHAHTCPKPRWRFSWGSASNKLTFNGTRESFEEREIQSFYSKVCFWRKIQQEKVLFYQNVSTLKIPGFLDSSKYFTSTNSKNFLGNSLIFKILHKFKRSEKISHFDSWKNNF